MNSYGSFDGSRLWTALALSGALSFLAFGGASADDLTCKGIKQALVSANLAVMRIERGPRPVTPIQASIAIGQMGALENVAAIACPQADVDRIGAVVGPRIETLRRLLPVEDDTMPEANAGADTPQTAQQDSPQQQPDGASSDPAPPAPPDRPSAADRSRSGRGSFSATTCTRIYYTKDGHRRWRCKR